MPTIKFSVFVLVLVLFVGCSQKSRVKEIKLGHSLDPSHSVHKAMVLMSDKLYEYSGGKMRIKIYPSSQLGSEREALELLQIGSLGMTKVSTGTLENFAPGMKVFGLPFLFRDKAHSFSVLDGEVGDKLLLESEKFWLRGLTYYDAGSRSFYTKEKPVHSPEDLDGLKIRVMQSQTAMNMVKAMGGSPTPISWGELYTALQQGIVDGAENNPPSFYLSRHYEVCKYYIIDEHTALPDVLIMSTHVWNSLSDQEQEWLMRAVKESVVYQRIEWEKAEKEALEQVQKAGVEIIYPDKSPFNSKVQDLFAEYRKDPDMAKVIDQINAL